MLEDLELLELSQFSGRVGHRFVFSVAGKDERIEAVLTGAKPRRAVKVPGVNREPFVLEFKFPPNAGIPQLLLQAETPDGETLPPMFLVPYASDADGWYMESTFN